MILFAVTSIAACASTPSPALPPSPSTCPPARHEPLPEVKETTKDKSPSAPATPESALARLFTEKRVDGEWFARSFANAVPPSKVQSIVDDIKSELGAFSGVEKSGEGWSILFAKGKVPAKIGLDGEGRIASLWFSPSELSKPLTMPEIEREIAALPGKVSYLVMTDGAKVSARDAETPMAVGSAFKLAILDALREKIDAKKAKWTDVIRLEDKHKSLPSGSLHTWPSQSPITLHSAAALMISVSDNTATDLLLDYVGRENAEKRAPGNSPFMSTRDAFALKAKANGALQARWRAGDAAAKKAMLPELAAVKLDADTKLEDSPSVDVEWMFSAKQLCELLSKNKSLDVTRINPGVAKKKDWDVVAYKGGSEPGVLNLSSWVEKAGKKHCVVTTWNDPKKDVDSGKLFSIHASLLATLR